MLAAGSQRYFIDLSQLDGDGIAQYTRDLVEDIAFLGFAECRICVDNGRGLPSVV